MVADGGSGEPADDEAAVVRRTAGALRCWLAAAFGGAKMQMLRRIAKNCYARLAAKQRQSAARLPLKKKDARWLGGSGATRLPVVVTVGHAAYADALPGARTALSITILDIDS